MTRSPLITTLAGQAVLASTSKAIATTRRAELLPVRDGGCARINDRELPTIHPPVAEIVVARADAAVALLLYMDAPGGWCSLAWAWSPRLAIQLGLNAHVDGVGIAMPTAALLAWTRGRQTVTAALTGAAAMAMSLPPAAWADMRHRRTWPAAAVVAALFALAYVAAGPRLAGSLGNYGRRWRAHDSLFAIVRERAGRERNQMYPDETANLLARLVVGDLFVAVVVCFVRRGASAGRVVEAPVGAFVPPLHPWYALWPLPMFALAGSWAWRIVAVLVPLGYRPLDGSHSRGSWHAPVWTPAVEHAPMFAALAIDRWWTSGIILKLGESSPRRW